MIKIKRGMPNLIHFMENRFIWTEILKDKRNIILNKFNAIPFKKNLFVILRIPISPSILSRLEILIKNPTKMIRKIYFFRITIILY